MDSVLYVDNIYYYNDGSVIPSVPTTAAPTPTIPAANVTSVFSDAYTNIAGTNLNPSWGQTTVATQVPIAGNNTLKIRRFKLSGNRAWNCSRCYFEKLFTLGLLFGKFHQPKSLSY